MPEIRLEHVTKHWGKFYAVDDLDLVIEDNAFVTLLGPSGCGKTTTHYAILDELAEQHRKRDEIPELTAYCDALHWMRPGRQYLCNVYNTVCHAFHLQQQTKHVAPVLNIMQ